MKPTAFALLIFAACGGKAAPSPSSPHRCAIAFESFDAAAVTRELRCPEGTTIRATYDGMATRQ